MFRCAPGEESSSPVPATFSHCCPVPPPLVAVPSVLLMCVGVYSRIRKSVQVGKRLGALKQARFSLQRSLRLSGWQIEQIVITLSAASRFRFAAVGHSSNTGLQLGLVALQAIRHGPLVLDVCKAISCLRFTFPPPSHTVTGCMLPVEMQTSITTQLGGPVGETLDQFCSVTCNHEFQHGWDTYEVYTTRSFA